MPSLPTVLMLSQEVHPIPPLKGAAVEQWIEAVAHGLQGYQALIVSPPHPERPRDETAGGVRYRRIAVSRLYKRLFRKLTRLDPYPYIQRVIRAARPTPPAIIHIHNAPGYVPALRAAFPAARLILHMHNEKKLPAGLPVDCLVGCSAYICRWFQAHVAWAEAPRFAQIRNGVDVDRFTPRWRLPATALQALKAAHQIPAGRINLLYVGRISPEKGLDLLLEAFALLDPQRFHLTVVGEWPAGDPASNERVRFARQLQARMAGLPVTVLGCIPPDGVAAVFPLGDLLVIPSRFEEPFSMVAIEAMASGVPVMALRRGGMVEYMRDGDNALLLAPDISPAELAAQIIRAVDAPAALQEMAGKARQMIEAAYSWNTVVAETEALYASLLEAA